MNLDEMNQQTKLILGGVFLLLTIIRFIAVNSGVFKVKNDELDINDDNVKKLYSYVYNAHFFATLSNDGVLIPISNGLFTDKKVLVSDLSEDYKMSMVFATFENKSRISSTSFNNVYKTLFNDDSSVTSFESYAMLNNGKVNLVNGYYTFNNTTPATDGPLGYGFMLVKAVEKKKTIELYDVMYANNEIDALGNENFTTYEYYGKDDKGVFAYKVDDEDFDVKMAIISNADKFKQYKTVYTKDKNGEYHLTSVEPVN